MNYFDKNQKPVVKIATINVIEEVANDIQAIHSFVDNKEGRKEAKNLFSQILKEHEPSFEKEDINDALDNGYYTDNCDYFLYIQNSVKN